VLRERLISAAFGAGWTLVCRLPESWMHALFMAGADIAWRRQGHRDADGKELRTLSRQVMRSYARYYLEAFRIQVIPRERLLSPGALRMDDPIHFDRSLEYLKDGRGVIYALPHMGNYEQAGAWVIVNGAGSLTTVVERLKPDSVYERFRKFRESLGFEVVPTSGGPHPFGVLAQRLRAGKLACILADRDLSDTGIEVDFFGEKALMAAGSAVLAVRTGAALMPVACWFIGDSGWGCHVYEEIPVPEQGTANEKVAVMMQRLASVFEEAVREHPEDWHMLQRVFVADLDPERLARTRVRDNSNTGTAGAGTADNSKRQPGDSVNNGRADP
jgi:phosphatidylinositol dimannoside acyltransferase